MTEHQHDPLDGAIRSLVARAVADAPPAPVIDERTIEQGPIVRPIGSAPSARNRWIVGGIAGLTTAAAVIAIALVARPDSAEAPAPATLPSVTDPTGTTLPTTAPPTTGTPGVVEGTAPPATNAPETAPPTAPPTPAPPADLPEVIVVAGDDGIQIDTGDALTDALLGESVRVATRTGDGVVFFQRREDPTILSVDTADPAGSPVPMPSAFTGTPVLHDAAVIGGEVVLLVESTPGDCPDPNECFGSVWAIWPYAGGSVILDEQNVWEAAWSRLSLSDTSVAVGMFSAEVSSSPWSIEIPDRSAGPRATGGPAFDPASVGLEDVYTDCSTCPRSLTIDRSGGFVGWYERTDDGGMTVTVARLGDGATATYEFADGGDLPPFVDLDIGKVEMDGTSLVSGQVIVNDPDTTSDGAARVYDLVQPGGEPIVIGKPASRMTFGT